jgi:hypothetical protein
MVCHISGLNHNVTPDQPDCGQENLVPASLEKRWRELSAIYLPVCLPSSIWRYSRPPQKTDAQQGWKLHVSATVTCASRILEKVGPLLSTRGIQFKGPVSLAELGRLNSGLHYGYAQIGKCLTVYPRNDREAVEIAELLDALTSGLPSPSVPFDFRLTPNSAVHYRYGAFQYDQTGDGSRTCVLRGPRGEIIPDKRNSAQFPDWVQNPFETRKASVNFENPNPLSTTFQVFCALSQRGKGGVYLAIDSTSKPERLCVIKEGRRDGEQGWDGSDGFWRVRNEKRNLPILRSKNVAVPQVYSSFELEGNFYLVTEFVEGPNLQSLLGRRKNRLSLSRALHYGIQIADMLSRIHAAGWVWRDCKPSNLVVCKDGTLRPLDFEGACPEGDSSPLNWATPAFAAPEICESTYRPSINEDLYSLGVVLYYLLAGRYPDPVDLIPLGKVRQHVPNDVCDAVMELLRIDANQRPSASFTVEKLRKMIQAKVLVTG